MDLELKKNAHDLLSRHGIRLNCPRKTELFSQAQEADSIYLIERGMVKLCRCSDEHLVAVTLCNEGDVIGEEAFFPNQAYDETAESLTPVTILRIPASRVREAGRTNSEVSLLLLGVLLERKRTLELRCDLLAGSDVQSRILLYLSDFANKISIHEQSYSLPLTQLDLAQLIGATRETTSATLNRLQKEGLVHLSRCRLTVPSRHRLRQAAKRVERLPAALIA